MRTVAAMVAIAGLVALFPQVNAANDCNISTSPAHACQAVSVPWPGSPVPESAAFGMYYVWVGPGHCVPPTAPDCRGVPAGPGSTLGLVGVIYQESNGLPGLQRQATNVGGFRPPDKMVVA